MKNVLFKRMVMLIIMTVAVSAVAIAQEKGDKAIGANLVIGSGDSFTNYGLGAKFLYNVTDPVRLAAEFDYFLKKDGITMWDASVYGHYLIPLTEKFTLYPSAGLGLINTKASNGQAINESLGELGNILGIAVSEDGSTSSSDFVFSLGGGAEYELTDNLALNGEFRYKIKDGSRINIALGIAYKF
ncbi:outer membrane protein [Dysgonomonas gadei]|uniref:outer membrane protein n=1 Tax=Dysgonomonas gadei TaxID=156974 RepID=UPI003AF171BE